MKKKKILFYGSCQIAVLSQFFLKNSTLNELFEVIKCDKTCSPMNIWRSDESNFAVWTKENRLIQKDFFHIIHEKIKQADIFIFQSTERQCISELTTEALCEISNGKNICIPNTRLFIYCNDSLALSPYIEYAQSKVEDPKNSRELVDFLRNSEDPELIRILERDYPISTNYQRYRNENSQRAEEDFKKYQNYISMESFIKDNYKKNLLALRHNHMSMIYFIELMNRLFENLDLKNLKIKKEEIKIPRNNPEDSINPFQFDFFRKYFPELLHLNNLPCPYPLWQVIEHQYFKSQV
jgi:hypothetical protein